MTQNIYFTSDTHFGHKNIASATCSNWSEGYRNFSSLEEHDEEIFNQIMSLPKDSILYHLGDFAPFKNKKQVSKWLVPILEHLHIILIRGNHEDFIAEKTIDFDANYKQLINSFHLKISESKYLHTHNQLVLELERKTFLLSHHPFQDFRGYDFHLHGHVHGDYEGRQIKNRLDVGVDVAFKHFGKYRPFHYSEIKQLLNLPY